VVDATGRTPPDAQVFSDAAATRTLVATTPDGAARRGAAWAQHGARVWTFAPDKAGRVPIRRLLRKLAAEGCLHVLCEGGGRLAGSLHDADAVDEYSFFYAPAVLGDSDAIGAVMGCGNLLAGMRRLRCMEVNRFGADIRIRARRA